MSYYEYMNIVQLKNVEKTYRSGKLNVPVLKGISLTVKQGEMVAIMGPSGSGKSTLMNIIGLLDRPTVGELLISEQPITLAQSASGLAHIRSDKIGFIFQSFNLLPRLSALENVLLPTIYQAEKKNRRARAKDLLTDLGLGDRVAHKPTELSGGEKQRVAIARALINDPDLILADEPTGNLDTKSGKEVMRILSELNSQGKTIVIITHDPSIASQCQRTVRILDGMIDEGDYHA
jgi:putative ABC transport system ATP-binding protein